MHDDVETITDFLYLGDAKNSNGGCEAAVISRFLIRMGIIQSMPRFTLWKNISSENQWNCIQRLCEMNNAL